MQYKPLRYYQIQNNHQDDGCDDANGYQKAIGKLREDIAEAQLKYMSIVCISCSSPARDTHDNGSSDGNDYGIINAYKYGSGAGYDEESWAHGLNFQCSNKGMLCQEQSFDHY